MEQNMGNGTKYGKWNKIDKIKMEQMENGTKP